MIVNQDVLTLMSLIMSMLLSLVAILVSFYTFSVQRREGSYSDVDNAYFRVLELGIKYPALRNWASCSTYFQLADDDDFRLQYESYAYICWNIIETIYDRQEDEHGKLGISSTWLPVMVEESRLHYHWFCRNLHMFKESFRRFVMSQLNAIELHEGKRADLDAIYPRLLQDFPSAELKSRQQFEVLLAQGHYKLYLARHSLGDFVTGYAFVFEPTAPKIAWLDYLAVDEHYRNAGFGAQIVDKLAKHLQNRYVGIMLEVEPPTSDDPEVRTNQHRRIAFYARIGAKQLDTEYLFPYVADSYPMLLFFRPIAKMDVLPKEQIQAMIRSAYAYIHSDVPERDSVLERFIHKVQDNHL